MDKDLKTQIIEQYKLHEGDTGSPEVQIAILTSRINHLNEHLKQNKRIITRAGAFSRWLVSAEVCSTISRQRTLSATGP